MRLSAEPVKMHIMVMIAKNLQCMNFIVLKGSQVCVHSQRDGVDR